MLQNRKKQPGLSDVDRPNPLFQADLGDDVEVKRAQIRAIDYYLPEQILENEELAGLYDGWSAERIRNKLGISERHIAAEDETSADMAVEAGRKLFERGVCTPEDVDFVILCTQSPDYFLPTSACLVQHRLGIPKSSGAFDFNLGCSGFIYGLSMAKGLIETGQAENVLLITSETYSKYIHKGDRATRPLFGDAAAATLISGVEEDESATEPLIGPFVFGTDGGGAEMLIVPAGGHRMPKSEETGIEQTDVSGGIRSQDDIYMHGPAIFSFAIDTVPPMVEELLEKAQLTQDDVDLFVFHQANDFMLERLRRECDIPPERFVVDMQHVGNTVSATIPIALVDSLRKERIKPGMRVMLAGFGVGLSWGGTLVQLPDVF